MSRRPASGGGLGGAQRCGVRGRGRELQAWVWGTSGERRSGLIRTGPRTGKGRKEGGRETGERDKETSGEHVHVGSPPFPKRLPITPLLAGSGRRASPPPLALHSGLWGLGAVGVGSCEGDLGETPAAGGGSLQGWAPWLTARCHLYLWSPLAAVGGGGFCCLRHHGDCLFRGVTFWRGEKLFAAALNLQHPRQSLPGPYITPSPPTSSAPTPSASAQQAPALPNLFWCQNPRPGLPSQGAFSLGPLLPASSSSLFSPSDFWTKG